MKLISLVRGFARALRNPGRSLLPKPTQAQKHEINEAVAKQKFYGDLPGPRHYRD